MANSMQGLRAKPSYEQLIGVAVSDELENIKFPNRDSSCLRNGYVLSQLDGEGTRIMERQQEIASKEAYKEHVLKQIATHTGANIHDLRNESHQELRTDRINQALNPNAQFYNIARSGHDLESLHSLPPSDGDDISAQTIPRSEASHQSRQDVANHSSAVADLTNELERQKQIAEYERQQQETIQSRQLETVRQEAAAVLQSTTQTLTEQSAQNAEGVRQQVIAEAGEQHNRMKEECQKEVLEQLRINEAEAHLIINQVTHQTQQEAQHQVGSVIVFAEQAHRNAIRAQKNKAEQAEAKLNERIKTQQTSNHNTTHKNERTTSTPDNRANPKAKTGPSPKKSPAKLLAPIPPFPTGEQASGSQDQPKHDNPESEHPSKGKQGRPSNTQGPQPKASNIRQEAFNKNSTPSTTTTHGTKKDNNKSRSYWGKIGTKSYSVDQLYLRKWGYPKTRNGKPKVLSIPQLIQILF